MRRLLLAALVVMLAGSAAFAQGEFALKETTLSARRAERIAWGSGYMMRIPEDAANVQKLPEMKGEALHMRGNFGRRSFRALVELADKPRLYIDSDGDGDFAEEEPFEGTAEALENYPGGDARSLDFGVVNLQMEGAEPLKVRIEGQQYRADYAYLRVRPAVSRSGEVELGGKTYHVDLVDCNSNGRYNDVTSAATMFNADALLIDLDGDGELGGGAYFAGGEVLPLPKLMQVDGSWYSVSLAEDGSKITLAEADPALGTLKWNNPDATLDLVSENGFHRLGPGQKQARLPEGTYRAFRVELKKKGPQGAEWVLRSSETGELRQIRIRDGATTVQDVGHPLKGTVSVNQQGEEVTIGYELKGACGEQYTAGAEKRGRRQPAPDFKVLSESDEVLVADQFEYG